MNSRSFRPALEGLEERIVPYSLNGYQWANHNVSASFMPDRTPISSASSDLFATYDGRYTTATWQREFARALQTWATVTPLNFHFVADNGLAGGMSGTAQDSRFGDIRLGATRGSSSYLAYAYPPFPTNTMGADVVLNSSSVLKIGTDYDLYSVLLHEVGHALGLEHSTAWNSVLYPAVTGVYTGLFPDDVAGIQAIYGARQPDAFDRQAANDTFAFATWLSLVEGGATITADLASTADVDYYRVVVPGGSDGTLKVSLDARGISLLGPALAVNDAKGRLVGSASAGAAYGTEAQVTLSGLTAGHIYTIRADGASSDVFGMGTYRLNLRFGGGTDGFQTPPPVALTVSSWSSTFPVSWSNRDPAGSATTGYDVYVSAGGGPFALWLEGTTATSAVFTGEFDRVYQFQAFAVDNAGQPQQAHPLPGTQVAPPFTVGSVPEDATRSAGLTVAHFTTKLREIEPRPVRGIAVAGVSGRGAWQYSLNNGRTWLNLGSPSSSAARLLRATDRIRFLPSRDWNGTAVASYHVWDRTAGVAGQTVNPSAGVGKGSAFGPSRYGGAIRVTPRNDAPVLPHATPLLPAVKRIDDDPAGTVVSQLLAGVRDADPRARPGVAVVATTGRGAWQYSRDEGNTWTPFGPVSAWRARLLGDTDLIRFVPNPSGPLNGVATIRYLAWDQSNPQAETANLSSVRSRGGITPYSAAVRTARLLINGAPPVGPASIQSNATAVNNASVLPDSPLAVTGVRTAEGVDMALALFLENAQDADGDRLDVAVTGVSDGGSWQYSLDGGVWQTLRSLSSSSAPVLGEGDRLRFVPAEASADQAWLTLRAWDGSAFSTVNRLANLLIEG